MTQTTRRVRQTATTAVIGAMLIMGLIAAVPVHAQTGEIGNFCAGQFVNPANCTANDVLIEAFEVVEVINSCRQAPVGEATVIFNATIVSNSPDRYGIGLFVNTQGESAISGTECLHDYLAPFTSNQNLWILETLESGEDAYFPPFPDLNDDFCGDIPGQSRVQKELQQVTIACNDISGNGFVDINACSSWENNANQTCSGLGEAVPGTPSKCGCADVPTNIPAVPPELTLFKTVNGQVGSPESNETRVNIPEGTPINYSITIRNDSNLPVLDASFSDILDLRSGRLVVQDVTFPTGVTCNDADLIANQPGVNELQCQLGDLFPNDEIVIGIVLGDDVPGVCINFDNFATTEGIDDLGEAVVNMSNTTYARLDVCPNSEDPGIRIRKGTIPAEDPQAFNFSGTAPEGVALPAECTPLPDGADLDFILTGDAGPAGSSPANECFFINPPTGEYTFTEAVTAGWDLTNISCSRGQGDTFSTFTPDVAGRAVTIDFFEGGFISCTFVNEVETGTIIVEKITDPAVTTQDFTFTPSWRDNFSLQGSGSRTFTGLRAATEYTIGEIVPDGWTLETATCVDETDNNAVLASGTEAPLSVTLQADQVVRCTFDNSVARGQITVAKSADPADDTTFNFSRNFGADFTLQDPSNASVAFEVLPTGLGFEGAPDSYRVEEVNLPDGWNRTSASCTDDNDPGASSQDPFSIAVAPGQQITCTFNNSQDRGEIIVSKVTDPADSSQSFTFNPSWGDSFTLEGGQNEPSGPLLAGPYDVTETVPANWTQTNAACSSNQRDGTILPSSIDLQAGETITCQFNNAIDRGTIVVNKSADPETTDQVFSFSRNFGADFDLIAGGTAEFDQLLPSSEAGNYQVSEQVPADWTLDSATCTGADSRSVSPDAIDLQPGETVICDFVNRIDRGSITVTKVTEPATTEPAFGFTLSANFGQQTPLALANGESETYVELLPSSENGTYSVAEIPVEGWDLLSATCESADRNGVDPAQIDLLPGEDLTCTFTNTQQQGRIVIVKNADPDNLGTAFDFTASWGQNTAFSLAHAQSFDSGSLPVATEAGSIVYNVAESIPVTEDNLPIWTLDDIVCTSSTEATPDTTRVENAVDIVLEPGETVTCEFLNSINRGDIVVVKETVIAGPEGDETYLTEQTFNFDSNLPGSGVFTLGGTDSIAPPDAITVEGVLPSGGSGLQPSYNIREIPVDGWTQVSNLCTSALDPDRREFADRVVLLPGDTVTCTFVNRIETGSITVVKNATAIDPQDATQFEFTTNFTDPATFTLANGASESVSGLLPFQETGTAYSVIETIPTGWRQTGVLCESALRTDVNPASIELLPGEDLTCTFDNEEGVGQIRIVKVATPPTEEDIFEFEILPAALEPLGEGRGHDGPLTGIRLAGNNAVFTSPGLQIGTYTVEELVPENWQLDAVECVLTENEVTIGTVGRNVENPTTLEVNDGDLWTCTFENSRIPADVTVFKTSSPTSGTTVERGEEITYTLTVDVADAATTAPVVLTDTLSSGLTRVGATVALPSGCSASGQIVTCSLPAGTEIGTYTFVYSALLRETARVSVDNSVVPSGDDDPTCVAPGCTTTHPLTPDVIVSKAANPASGTAVDRGDTITYTLTAAVNRAPTTAEVRLVDTLSDGLTLDQTSLPQGCSSAGQVITCALAAPADIGSYTFSYQASVDQDAVTGVANTVRPEGDDDPRCLLPDDCTTDHPLTPDVTVSKAAVPPSGTPVAAGQTIAYTLSVQVSTAATEAPVILADTLGAGLTLDASSLPQDCTAAGQVVTCTLASGAEPSETAYTFSYNASVDEDATVRVSNRVEPTGGVCVEDNDCTTDHPLIGLTAAEICVNDVPYVDYNVVIGQGPAATSGGRSGRADEITIRWIAVVDESGDVIETLTTTDLSGRLLWPGAETDGADPANGVGWPGWEFTDGEWVEVPTNARPEIAFEVEIDGATERVEVAYPPSTPFCSTAPRGEIRVVKNTSEPTDGQFTFTLDNDNPEAQVSASETIGSAEGTFGSFDNLVPTSDGGAGVYSITETPVEGWFLEDAFCDGGNTPSSITLGAGEVVTCTFINNLEPFRVTVTEECRFDVPYVVYDIEPLGQPRLDGPLTIEWLLGGTEPALETLTDQPLSGELLWFGTLLDAQGGLIALPTDQERNNMFLRFTAGDDTAPARRLSYPPLGSSCSLPDPEPVPSLTAVSTWVLALFLLLMGLGAVRYRQLRQ